MMGPLIALPVAVLLLMVLAACGRDDAPASGSGEAVRGKITVFAAASLTEAFKEIADAFTEKYAGTDIDFNFGGTPTLRTQLEQGARADVFASANVEQMELARAGGAVEGTSSTFARNSLVIITPSDNRARINGPADLKRDGLKLVVANPDVPVGAYTRQALAAMEKNAGYGAGFADAVLGNVVSLESNVKQVVAKVELGEADAGVVYGTDVTPSVASKLRRIEIPDAFNVIAEYPVALVKERSNDAVARAFIDFLLSGEGQAILMKYGFLSAG